MEMNNFSCYETSQIVELYDTNTNENPILDSKCDTESLSVDYLFCNNMQDIVNCYDNTQHNVSDSLSFDYVFNDNMQDIVSDTLSFEDFFCNKKSDIANFYDTTITRRSILADHYLPDKIIQNDKNVN